MYGPRGNGQPGTAAHFPGAAGNRAPRAVANGDDASGHDRTATPSTSIRLGVTMTRNFEYISYNDADRIAVLENRAAELERRLLAALPPDGTPRRRNVATQPAAVAPGDSGAPAGGRTAVYPAAELAGQQTFDDLQPGEAGGYGDYPDEAGGYGDYPDEAVSYGYGNEASRYGDEAGRYGDETGGYGDEASRYGDEAGRYGEGAGRSGDDAGPVSTAEGDPDGGQPGGGADAPRPGGRTEALINHGRSRARPRRSRRILRHWRMIAVGAVALLAGLIAVLLVAGSGGGSWPASVTTVQAQIKQACENPDVAAEPSGLNFACGKDTQQVLWVFSLLTSGDNPGFVDQSTGRKGLEPIQPSQGGDIAWSLNLHHPYNAASPIDSLQVAARAINNIISGATLTSTSGSAVVEPGLESKAANCQRYTGSPKIVTRSGYPARCAAPVSGAAGEAALVNDVFQQWMGGTPSRIAQQAGVLYQNAANPGDAQVQAILSSLPASGG